jgi:hypothetical protein
MITEGHRDFWRITIPLKNENKTGIERFPSRAEHLTQVNILMGPWAGYTPPQSLQEILASDSVIQFCHSNQPCQLPTWCLNALRSENVDTQYKWGETSSQAELVFGCALHPPKWYIPRNNPDMIYTIHPRKEIPRNYEIYRNMMIYWYMMVCPFHIISSHFISCSTIFPSFSIIFHHIPHLHVVLCRRGLLRLLGLRLRGRRRRGGFALTGGLGLGIEASASDISGDLGCSKQC